MSTLTRKQRELQEREQLILATARPMVVRDGYHGLNMDRLAESLEYSKGTIYNHFDCKEEIILALAIETLGKRTELFERAATFPGLPRERMLAVGVAAELFVRLHPDHFAVEQIIRTDSIWQKTSENRRNSLRASEMRCMGVLSGIVRDAAARGDLELDEGVTAETIVFGLWAMSYGAYSIIATSQPLEGLGIDNAFVSVRTNQTRLIDGFQWRPLSSDHDYGSAEERIVREWFPDEFQQIGVA